MKAKSKAKSKPLTLPSILAWLEKQPARKRYDWNAGSNSKSGGCLIHQYLRSQGLDPDLDYQKVGGLKTKGRYQFFDGDVSMERPFTFGAALRRARAVS